MATDEETPFMPKQTDSDDFQIETEGGYRDKGWAIFFLIHLVGIVGVGVLYCSKGISLLKHSGNDAGLVENTHQVGRSDLHTTMVSVCWLGAVLAATIFSIGWFVIIKKNPNRIIYISMVGYCVCSVLVAVVLFGLGNFLMGGLSLLSLVFVGLFYFCARSRIPFAQAMLKASVASIEDNKQVGCVAVSVGLSQIVWIAFWVFTAISVFAVSKSFSTGTQVGIWLSLVFSLSWTCGVMSNVIHVTVAGVVASWWLVPEETSATSASFKRSMTTSFGSICLGSLIVAVLETIRTAFRMLRDYASDRDEGGLACLACCLECCVSNLEDAVQFINKYAYTQVAIHGKSFMTAARDTWDLLCNQGWDLIINEDMTGFVTMCGVLTGGFIAALSACAIGFVVFHSNATADILWLIAIVGFLIGMFVSAIPMSIISSAVATTYVIWAQFPS